ncbi:MAG: ribonuclease J, partial [Actinobacteria bacterium]|nr:ribonuclease J [Actinomycetota bacterium]
RYHDSLNRLAKIGAEVLPEETAAVHASGHGHADELQTILALLRPRNLMPVHGEFRMLAAHARLAQDMGIPEERIVLAENGSVVELSDGVARIVDHVSVGSTFVDGVNVGDARDVALRDRRHLAEDGVLIIVATLGEQNGRVAASPEVISRGFAEPGPLFEEARDEAGRVLDRCVRDDVLELKLIQEHLHDAVGQLVYERTGRRPMILPVIVEV